MSEDDTFTKNDVQGYLGINYHRQNNICKRAGIVPKTRVAESGHEISFYTAYQFRKFLNEAGYLYVIIKEKHKGKGKRKGREVLVHKKFIKEHPNAEVIK